MKRPPTDFDLVTSRMPGEFYKPSKARDPREIARRRSLQPGELILEQQRDGLHVARMALAAITEKDSLQFALPLISLSALNSVWHQYAEPERNIADSVRRRRIKIPQLKDWQDADHLLTGVRHSLGVGEPLANRLVLLYGTESKQYDDAKRDFANCIGGAALAGACVVALGDGPIPGTQQRAQEFAREQSIRLAESRHAVAEQLGSAPTLAQMADGDSDLSVHWRRNAPPQAFDAYAAAIAA